MGKLFGTDGVRGIANKELTPELAYRLGRAGGYVLAKEAARPLVVVGKDTRISGDMLEGALIAGLCSMGADVIKVGVIPTPAVAYLTTKYGANCGAVISASHNPYEFNGIKFFGPTGYKLPDEVEESIEELVLKEKDEGERPTGRDIGRVLEEVGAEKDYADFCLSCYEEEKALSGLTVVIDCANGASYKVAPHVWRRLGAKVIPIHCEPDGVNINDRCGSTHPQSLIKAVLENQADLGLAYDGDADRVVAVDETGTLVDGDHIMVICGLHLNHKGRLNPARVVATVMSNVGLKQAFQSHGIEVYECPVGDRYVLEEMIKTGAKMGGEQSGHIIFMDHATTGDGLVSSLKLVEVMKATGLPLSKLAAQMKTYPQILVNLDTENKDTILDVVEVKEAIARAEEKLGDWGRILVRPSGTEPKIRVMAQGPDETLLKEVVGDIKKVIDRYR